MDNLHNKLVNMQDVIDNLAIDYNIPAMRFEDLVELGKKTVIVYNLDAKSKYITFDDLCHHIKLFVSTPFGLKVLRELS